VGSVLRLEAGGRDEGNNVFHGSLPYGMIGVEWIRDGGSCGCEILFFSGVENG